MVYTFEQLMAMDMHEQVAALNRMTDEERKAVIIPPFDPTRANKNLKEATDRTP